MKKIFDIRSYLTFLSRNKVYTAINVFGFSVSLMFVIIIGVYVQQELTMDRMHSKADRIYSLGIGGDTPSGDNGYDMAAWGLERYLASRYPEIEQMCAFTAQRNYILLPDGEKPMTDILCADSTFFSMFDFPIVMGDRRHLLDNLNSGVVSEDFARRAFGRANPIGQRIFLSDSTAITVTGVMKNMEGTSIKKADVVIRFENMRLYNSSFLDPNMGNAIGCTLMLLAKPGADLKAKEADMTQYFRKFFWIFMGKGNEKQHVMLTPLRQTYFSQSTSCNANRGDARMVKILVAVGLVILLFSIMNYINLTTTQATRRAREMATRRLLGSQRRDIIFRLMSESFFLCSVSLVLGLALSVAFAPYAGQLFDTHLRLGVLLRPTDIVVIAALLVGVSLVSGIIPAVVISRAKPIDVVRGTFRTRTKMVLGKVFITVQNVITIVLVAVALTMYLQTRHLVNAPLGYDRDNLMYVNSVSRDLVQTARFLESVQKLPCVELVSACQGTPLDRGNNMTVSYGNRSVSYQILNGDRNYMKILGLKLDRDYRSSVKDGVFVNNRALFEAEAKPDARQLPIRTREYNSFQLCGVLKDFTLGTITDGQSPVLMEINDSIRAPWGFLIKVKGDQVEAFDRVKATFESVFKLDIPNTRVYLDQMLRDHFAQQIRLSKIVSLFAFIAVVISMLGLVAMSSYFITQRRKEIAVRKVFGSTNRQILGSLVRSFMLYVGVAFVIAVPIIWYFMSDWLAGYSYRIALSWWIFAVAGVFCLLVSLLSVYFQSRAASNENPVNHIKDE